MEGKQRHWVEGRIRLRLFFVSLVAAQWNDAANNSIDAVASSSLPVECLPILYLLKAQEPHQENSSNSKNDRQF